MPHTLHPSALLSAFKRHLRLGVCLLAATLGIAASANNAPASEMFNSLPDSPFVDGHKDLRFSYWESLGQIKVSPKVTLEIPLGFTPIPNYQYSRILGSGFAFPLLESTCLPKSENEFEIILPSGQRVVLHKTKTANQLQTSGWQGTINGREITVKSSSSWTFIYNGGRLKTLKTADGTTVEFKSDAQGNYWILANGKNVLTLKPAYDTNTRKFYHLNVQNGKHAILRLGTRPVLVKTSEKDTFGRNKEKKTETQALTSVQWDGEKERKYGIGLESLEVGGDSYQWNKDTSIVLQERGNKIEFEKIMGINCVKQTMRNGAVFVHGRDEARGISIEKQALDDYQITEFIPNGNFYGKIRKIYTLSSPNSTPVMKMQYWYDENGNVQKIHQYTPQGKILLETSGLLTRAKNLSNGEILWEKKTDEKSRVVYFKYEKDEYSFDYEKSSSTGRVLLIAKRDGQTLKKEIPLSQISLLLSTEH